MRANIGSTRKRSAALRKTARRKSRGKRVRVWLRENSRNVLVRKGLLKWVHYRQDVEGLDLELRYFRDVDGREVDFVVTDRRRPILMVECKLDDAALDPSLRYLKAKFPECPAWQIHAQGIKDYQTPEGIRIAPAIALLETLV
jgi:hypothetical protein